MTRKAKLTSNILKPETDDEKPKVRVEKDPAAAKQKLIHALTMCGPQSQLNKIINEAIDLL